MEERTVGGGPSTVKTTHATPRPRQQSGPVRQRARRDRQMTGLNGWLATRSLVRVPLLHVRYDLAPAISLAPSLCARLPGKSGPDNRSDAEVAAPLP